MKLPVTVLLSAVLLSSCGPGVNTGVQSFGNAASFTGQSGSYATLGVPSSLTTLPSVFTVEAFVFFRSLTNSNSAIFIWGPTNNGPWVMMAVTSAGSLVAGFPISACATQAMGMTSPGRILINTKYHLAAAHDGSTISIFINGVKESSLSMIGGPASSASCSTASLGAYIGGTTTLDNTNGIIDEVRFSSVVRYTNSFSVPTAPFSNDAGTYFLWHADSGNTNGILSSFNFGFAGSFPASIGFSSSPFP